MFASSYFPVRYFAPKYFPKLGATFVPPASPAHLVGGINPIVTAGILGLSPVVGSVLLTGPSAVLQNSPVVGFPNPVNPTSTVS